MFKLQWDTCVYVIVAIYSTFWVKIKFGNDLAEFRHYFAVTLVLKMTLG